MNKLSNEPILSVSDISLSFFRRNGFFRGEKHEIFTGLSFDIYRGDSIGVIGRNGAGKSSLLKVLAGILSPDQGDVLINCESVALLALGAGFNHELSGRKNILINGLLLGFPRSEVDQNIDQIIEYSGVGDAIEDPIKTYSSGMRSRLAFAIAINMRPDVLLIDEALGVGDAEFMRKSSNAIRERVVSNQTVVLVSHHADTIRELCHKVIWIEGGKLKKIGVTADILEQYERYVLGEEPE